jgi:hypothetical protein
LKKFGKFLAFMVVAGLAWTVWAAGAFYDLTKALQSGDPVGLERRIDWISVRQKLREDLLGRPLASTSDRTIDALLTQQGIINLLRTAKIDDRGWDAVSVPAPGDPAFAWRRIRYAFYTGSPFSFRVDLQPDSDATRAPLVLLFRWTGDWQLVRIFVPDVAPAAPTVAAAQSPDPSEPAALPSPALPSETPRAALYEEVAGQQGKRYDGTVTWRAGQVTASAGNVPGFTVTAQVAMPQRPLSMTLSIRRNLDATLPATHTMEVSFDLPPDSTTGGIADMIGVMMKPDQESPGQHLAASRVKVRDGFYILGLSAVDIDARHNNEALRSQPWFGIPIRYKNGSRAVIVLEKGEIGEKIFAEAFTRWNAGAASANAQKK